MFSSKEEVIKDLEGILKVNGDVEILDKENLKTKIDDLVYQSLFNPDIHIRKFIYWIIWSISLKEGIYPSSILELYKARGRGDFGGFTVPAINLRMLTYHLARRIFKVAKKLNCAAFIFEIAKSEIGYTSQRPWEYTTSILAAALKEDYKGPVFIQGDHFQIKRKNYFSNPEEEIHQLKKLIKEAINAGFFNIDIDTSTLVDLEKPTLEEQQFHNYYVSALIARYIREIQPQGVEVSLGGEIGEIGEKNSTPQDLHAYMRGFLKEISPHNIEGLSKIAVQTGTSHGGVVLPDGSIASVKLDFDTLRELSYIARKDYGLAGAVQHGASTLPKEMFHKFPEVETAEIHLATQFQNIVYENIPQDLREKMYDWIKKECKGDYKEGQTEEQFIYKTRKKALGPFKKQLFDLPSSILEDIGDKLENLFEFLFRQLNVENTRSLVEKYIKPQEIRKTIDDILLEGDLGKLEGAD